jgi:hypothetical protein
VKSARTTYFSISLVIIGIFLTSLGKWILFPFGLIFFILGLYWQLFSSESFGEGKAYWTFSRGIRNTYEAVKRRVVRNLPSGISNLSFDSGNAGGDNIAFFAEGSTESYFKYLNLFVSEGLNNNISSELVVFVARNAQAAKVMWSKFRKNKNKDRLIVLSLDQLESPRRRVEFFELNRPKVEGLIKELEEKQMGRRVKTIRLITDDISILQARDDYRRTLKKFNRNFDDFVSSFPYLKGTPFFTIGTYHLGTLRKLVIKENKKIGDEIRIILAGNNSTETIVLTKSGEILTEELALKHIFENHKYWKNKTID